MHFLGDKDLNRDTYCCDSVFEVVGMCDGGWGGGGVALPTTERTETAATRERPLSL